MIKIESPYSNEFIKEYWEWFEEQFKVDETTRLSQIFVSGEYILNRDFTLKDVIINPDAYIEISQIIKKVDNSKLKSNYDFVKEYNNFVSRDSELKAAKMNALKLYKEIDIKVCPYCNLNNISLYKDESGKKRGHLDHFYCKRDYPYLALSIYNLVPICSTCNSSFKGLVQILI